METVTQNVGEHGGVPDGSDKAQELILEEVLRLARGCFVCEESGRGRGRRVDIKMVF